MEDGRGRKDINRDCCISCPVIIKIFQSCAWEIADPTLIFKIYSSVSCLLLEKSHLLCELQRVDI